MQQLPLRRAALGCEVDDVRATAQVGAAELVELGPALRDVVSPLLHDRVEPCQHKQQLRSQRRTGRQVLLRPALVCALHILLHAGRRLKSDLEAQLQQCLGELGVSLRRQKEPEALVLLQRVDLLLEAGQPRHRQVDVLEAQPLAVACALTQQVDRDLRLALAHRDLVVPVLPDARVCDLHQLLAGIRARRGDEEHRLVGRRLMLYKVFDTVRARRDTLDVERLAHKRGHRDRQLVWLERLEQQQALERRHLGLNFGWQARTVLAHALAGRPWRPHGSIVQLCRLHERREVGSQQRKRRSECRRDPCRRLHRGRAAVGRNLSEEEVPLLWRHGSGARHVACHVHAKRQAVGVEERARHVVDGQVDERVAQHRDARGHVAGRRVGAQRGLEQIQERSERELIHGVERGEVLDEEVHGGTALCDGAVRLALLVEARLQRLGVLERL
mmetsp:Transcript_6087/g.18812  ORF Transcript_6087/g.18812 Transcript_6087/m.18812 type:complete len:444 (-) Transcript_6087:5335-6666(-)